MAVRPCRDSTVRVWCYWISEFSMSVRRKAIRIVLQESGLCRELRRDSADRYQWDQRGRIRANGANGPTENLIVLLSQAEGGPGDKKNSFRTQTA